MEDIDAQIGLHTLVLDLTNITFSERKSSGRSQGLSHDEIVGRPGKVRKVKGYPVLPELGLKTEFQLFQKLWLQIWIGPYVVYLVCCYWITSPNNIGKPQSVLLHHVDGGVTCWEGGRGTVTGTELQEVQPVLRLKVRERIGRKERKAYPGIGLTVVRSGQVGHPVRPGRYVKEQVIVIVQSGLSQNTYDVPFLGELDGRLVPIVEVPFDTEHDLSRTGHTALVKAILP